MDTAISVDLSVLIVYTAYTEDCLIQLYVMLRIITFPKNRRHFQNFSTVGKQGEGQLRDRGGQQRRGGGKARKYKQSQCAARQRQWWRRRQ